MTRAGARRPAARGACQVCLKRWPLLKLGGYAVSTHHRDGARCPGSGQQPIARTVRYATPEGTR